MLYCTGEKLEKIYDCTQCDRQFKGYDLLVQHLSTHECPKLYGCGKCGQDFHLPGELRSHMKTHEVESPVLKFSVG